MVPLFHAVTELSSWLSWVMQREHIQNDVFKEMKN